MINDKWYIDFSKLGKNLDQDFLKINIIGIHYIHPIFIASPKSIPHESDSKKK